MVKPTNLVRIGVMGTHSTGKTLLMRGIEKELRSLGIAVGRTGRLGRRAALVPLPKMQYHTVESTRWVIATGIADEVAAAARLGGTPTGAVLADRACWDALAYFRAAQEWHGRTFPRSDREALHRLVTSHSPYNLLFATRLDPAAPVERQHDYDSRYRTLVDRHTHDLLREENLFHVQVTSDPASHELAVEQAVQRCTAEIPL
uniref:Uncharacterized protein n=1 Tax=Streptomyces sp. ML694-90F3 TaxID=1265536 RepID=A0A077KRE0_9ACTN|nr:hypothetical protein [Streptomyces sp. ML694-90F3]